MIKVTVQKNYIGMEDLLTGVGTVTQNRGPTGSTPVTITKINGAIFPYDEDYTMKEKFDALQALIDSLPIIIDEDGHILTGWINSSSVDLDLEHRLWRKTIDANTAEIYYYNELLFQYDPTLGNLIIPEDTDYVAADAVVTATFQAADTAIIDDINALVASLGTAAYLDVGTAALNVIQLDADAKLPAVDGSQLTNLPPSSSVPVGTVIWVAYETPDTGYLECNGQEVNRVTYAALFAKIGTVFGGGDGSTTFTVPDLRGEFIRGWDHGRGIDTGRLLGSYQADAFKSHTHTLVLAQQPNNNAGGGTNGAANVAGSSTTNATGGTETRPRNVALMPLIKATL